MEIGLLSNKVQTRSYACKLLWGLWLWFFLCFWRRRRGWRGPTFAHTFSPKSTQLPSRSIIRISIHIPGMNDLQSIGTWCVFGVGFFEPTVIEAHLLRTNGIRINVNSPWNPWWMVLELYLDSQVSAIDGNSGCGFDKPAATWQT